MKQKITINENRLKQIINESVKNVLNERYTENDLPLVSAISNAAQQMRSWGYENYGNTLLDFIHKGNITHPYVNLILTNVLSDAERFIEILKKAEKAINSSTNSRIR